ncbi:hypothetical protein EDB86DRAFT_3243981 [Lactarius hatsudake]|nr:hypothetical protein EDB86DRAFT_3243981 [Lactarius hatsudake]
MQGHNGKNPGARSSMGPAARPSAAAAQGFSLASPRPEDGPPSGRPTSEFLGSATFQTPEDQWFENFHHYEVTLEEMDAASLDVNLKEELSVIEQLQIRFFITVLQQMARADPMTALLSPAVGGSMQSQMEAELASMNLKSSSSARTFDSSSSFLSPDAANTVGVSSNAAATLAQQRAKLKAAGNAPHRISAPALASSGERGTWAEVLGQVTERGNTPLKRYPWSPGRPICRVPTSLASPPSSAFAPRAPMAASMVNTPLLPMFQKTSSNNSNDGQTVDLAAAKLNDLYGSSNVPRLDGPDKFRRPSKGHMHDGSSGSNNGVTNNDVYGDDGDLIQGHHAPGVGRVQSGSPRGLRNGGGGTWSAEATTEATRWLRRISKLRWRVSGWTSADSISERSLPDLPNELNTVQLAQLNGMNGVNPFNVNMNTLNLAAIGALPETQLLAAQIADTGGGFGLLELGFGMNGLRGGSRRSGGRSPGLGGGGSAGGRGGSTGNGGAKKDDEDFEPSVLNDVAGWLRTLRLHKYTPNFEGMTWKEMVVMDEQALEAQGVAALCARRKMLKTFEVVRKKMGIDDPAAPAPLSGESAPGASGSSGGSVVGSPRDNASTVKEKTVLFLVVKAASFTLRLSSPYVRPFYRY